MLGSVWRFEVGYVRVRSGQVWSGEVPVIQGVVGYGKVRSDRVRYS